MFTLLCLIRAQIALFYISKWQICSYVNRPNCFMSQDEALGHDDSAGHSAGPDATAAGSATIFR